MHYLIQNLSASEALVLAGLLGIAFGFSLRRQLLLQREATLGLSRRSRSRLLHRLTQAGLSFALLGVVILVGKEAQSVGYASFVVIASVAAISVLLHYFFTRKHRGVS